MNGGRVGAERTEEGRVRKMDEVERINNTDVSYRITTFGMVR